MDSKQRDFTQNGSSNVNLTLKQSYANDSQTPLFMTTLRRLIGEQFQRLTSSPEDSRVKTSATLENELVSRGVVLHSGNITLKRLGYFDQNTVSLRTYQHSLEGDSMSSLQTLPRSGVMRSGIVYQLPPLVRLTVATESSSFPTPTVADTFTGNLKSSQVKEGSRHSVTLSHAVMMWPTPTVLDHHAHAMRRTDGQKTDSMFGRRVMWNTPAARDWRDNASPSEKMRNSPSNASMAGGQLNPDWTEWLMGFPIGWSELSVSETQLYRNSRKSLRKQSKNTKDKILK